MVSGLFSPFFALAQSEQEFVQLVKNADCPYDVTNGLRGKHIAMWHSHGLYYELGNARWEWQRARLFQTVEDKFPATYVLQYIVPMLENAGATVMLPRERDTNPYEVVVDNDGKLATSLYAEQMGKQKWKNGKGVGFGYARESYKDAENPFEEGSYREAKSVQNESEVSTVTWTPTIPVTRRYAVYVSYKTVEHSAKDARYTVYHQGGKTSFVVNQTMGGGTWIYLGTFSFEEGTSGKVVLSNLSAEEGRVVTADAVRFGGGMGNIARCADGTRFYDNTKITKAKATSVPRNDWQPKLDIPYEVSGYPRWLEGARYYMQWAGIPASVFSPSNGTNDYTDDYKNRGYWVNYLAGGSKKNPRQAGLHIPVDMSFAFHTDGGTVDGDGIIGTLGIYQTTENGGKLGDGTSRSACRDLCNMVCNSIVDDIRRTVEPNWKMRGCRDKSYSEATSPRVPSALLELMSHESFGEMRLGNDPRFRFLVGRAIYKGILKFLSKRGGYHAVVQPLPVDSMAATMDEAGKVHLSWAPTYDELESTAVAERYVVYKRIGNADFDNGTVVDEASYTCDIPTDEIVSFRVTALNRGGQSMPSEILSVGRASQSDKKPILVINGFTRISAPDDFQTGDGKQAGFLAEQDNGVPDGEMIHYVGRQKEFDCSIRWMDDDAPGFGDSYGNMEQMVIAGNTFDYPAVHGRSILQAGYSFVSVSRAAASAMAHEGGMLTLNDRYSAIDLILGKQKQVKLGRKDANGLSFKTFDEDIQLLLTDFCKNGGSVFVSGSYVGSDLWQNPLAPSLENDKQFAKNILKYQWRDSRAATEGKIKYIPSALANGGEELAYYNRPNEESYVVESPDAIIPADASASIALRYAENKQGAAVVYGGNGTDNWRTVVMAFPFESITQASARHKLMQQVLDFLIKE